MFGLRAWPTPVRILPNRVDPVHRAASKPQKIGRIEVDSSIQIRPVISSTHSLRIVLTIPQFARPLAPFIAATVITYLGVAKLQDMAVNSTSSSDPFFPFFALLCSHEGECPALEDLVLDQNTARENAGRSRLGTLLSRGEWRNAS